MRLQNCIICSAQPRLRWVHPHFFFCNKPISIQICTHCSLSASMLFLTKKNEIWKSDMVIDALWEHKHKNWSNFRSNVFFFDWGVIHDMKRKLDILGRQKSTVYGTAHSVHCHEDVIIWFDIKPLRVPMTRQYQKKRRTMLFRAS